MKKISNNMSISDNAKQAIADTLKFVLGMVIISLIVNLAIRLDTQVYFGAIGEESFTEGAQLVFILFTIITFVRLAQLRPDLKHAAILIAGFFGTIFIRELDALFDLIVHGFWKYPALLIAIAALVYALRDWRQTVNQLGEILNAPAMKILVCGVILLLVYSRLFGMGSFWKDVMLDKYVGGVKTVAEEATELLAYCIMFYGALRTKKYLQK